MTHSLFMKESKEANNWNCRIKNKSPAPLWREKPYSIEEVISSHEKASVYFSIRYMAKFSNELIASRHKLASWNVRTSNLLLVFIVHDRWKLAPASQQYCNSFQMIIEKEWRVCRCGVTFIIHFSTSHPSYYIWAIIYTQFVIEFIPLIKKIF